MANDGTLLMEGASIVFRNFAGKEGQYNAEGDRNFCLLLEPETAERMEKDGWSVKYLRAREEGDEETPYVQVSIKYRNRRGEPTKPPTIVMITSKGRTTLPEEQVEVLDWVDIANVDLIVRPYKWDVNGKSGIKAYLKSLYVTIQEDALEQKYSDLPEIGMAPERPALEAGELHNIIQGEVISDEDLELLPARGGRIDD